MLWITRSGAHWCFLLEKYDNWNRVYKHFARWCDYEIWEDKHQHFIKDPDIEYYHRQHGDESIFMSS
ncbi:MAG: transposase [Bacteroidetes bacterium]|nr:transposase [Bacteroidota bacterium]